MRKHPRVPRTDTGNFNKFLTSLGLLLLGAALAIPYLYFRNTESLTIPARDLDHMTETGKNAIIGRQDAIIALEPWVVGVAVLLGALGLGLLIVGGAHLRSAQKSEDEESELRRIRARLEVEEMSPDEQAEKNTEQAETEVEQERRSAVEVGGQARGGDVAQPEATALTWTSDPRRRATVIARISGEVERAFRGRDIGSYELKWQVRIGSLNDQLRLDGVFESADAHLQDVVLKIRVSSDPILLRKTGRNIVNELVATLGRYQALTGRRSQGWLLAVVPEESDRMLDSNASAAADLLRIALNPFGEATLISERDLETLPDIFSKFFGGA
jgi:hypothetical protein